MMVLSTKLPTGLGWPSFCEVPDDVVPHWFRWISNTEETVPLPGIGSIETCSRGSVHKTLKKPLWLK